MEKSNDWVVGIMLGLFFIAGAASSGDWFTIKWMERSFGQRGSRIIYGVLGIILLLVSLRIRG